MDVIELFETRDVRPSRPDWRSAAIIAIFIRENESPHGAELAGR